jgi:6-phosphofructokinase 1
MRIGVLTGGGDVPGLNPCIKALVYRAVDEGCGSSASAGWAGLNTIRDPTTYDECIRVLDKQNTRTIDRTGGTMLHTSRTNPGRVRPKEAPAFLRGQSPSPPVGESPALADFTPHVLKVISRLGLDVLIPIGGDDTLSYGLRLAQEGIPVIAIPKTMDNDVHGTDYCIGFSTAITRSVSFIHQLRTSAGSHERLLVVELFGRYSGETSLVASYLAGVDRSIISEVSFDPEKLARLLVQDKKANPSHYAIVTISEGARMIGGQTVETGEADAYGHRKLGGIGPTTEKYKRLTETSSTSPFPI